jgi:hypothetical protein
MNDFHLVSTMRGALMASLGLVAACSSGGVDDAAGGAGGAGGATPIGVVHRPTPSQCTVSVPRPESQIPADWTSDAGTTHFTCEFDADCTERAHGYCQARQNSGFGDFQETTCRYGCASDDDCAEGRVCECGGVANGCVLAGCTTDADCGPRSLCIRTDYDDGCGARTQYRCQTARDTCASNADCTDGEECGYLDQEERHACQGVMCAVGRPFLVDGLARKASVRDTNAWQIPHFSGPHGLDAHEARLLADQWTQIGLMEHASIAAFARFAMQLLALGAPPTLVSEATEAMADETRHTAIAFAIASRFAGHAVGPGRLSIRGALDDEELPSILETVVLEGCAGETVAALEAQVAASAARDPVLGDALRRIAEDERRHSELAWRFVKWALSERPDLHDLAVDTTRRELARARTAAPTARDDGWIEAHGLVPEERRRTLRIDVLEQVVLPCMRALAPVAPTRTV